MSNPMNSENTCSSNVQNGAPVKRDTGAANTSQNQYSAEMAPEREDSTNEEAKENLTNGEEKKNSTNEEEEKNSTNEKGEENSTDLQGEKKSGDEEGKGNPVFEVTVTPHTHVETASNSLPGVESAYGEEEDATNTDDFIALHEQQFYFPAYQVIGPPLDEPIGNAVPVLETLDPVTANNISNAYFPSIDSFY